MARRIAIVEDDAAIRANYAEALKRHGYEVAAYAGRREAMEALRARLPDLAIIDIGLGDDTEGGFALCRDLRSLSPQLPIVFLTARDSDFDVVSGLRLGADDYLTKGVSLPHLMARIGALFRRVEALAEAKPIEERISRGELELDLKRFSALWKGLRIELTLTEFWIVHSLARHPGHVKNRDQLMRDAELVVDDATVTSHVKRVRAKFLAADPAFDGIETAYGLGYRWKAYLVTRFPLRAKLALVALVLLVLPWAGWLYVREMERFLLSAQEEALAATARAVATALHERPKLLVYRARGESELREEAERELRRLNGGVIESETSARDGAADSEITAILKALERASSRIWVVSRDYRVLALAGSLKRVDPPEPSLAQRALGWLLAPPTEDFSDAIAEDALAAGREVTAALQGAASTRTRSTRDGRAVVVSAAHPIWVGDDVQGAVVVEETTNRIASLRSRALERLLVVTLATFALVAAVLLWFATRISNRIRRLSDEAEAAIDARGRVARLTTASDATDEIGDLSRSFTTVLERLARYNAYLEALAGRLSHELRTPVAVVRSSLENLHAARTPEETRTYVARAEEGLGRLATILARMTEASRLEQGLSSATHERFDASAVVGGCVEGYRLAYAPRSFELTLPSGPMLVLGAADLLAQMLDKLVENAADFASAGTAIRISLGSNARLRVENQGPGLPEAIRDSLFDSMVSQRTERSAATPHLGLGLYIARLIAEFHGGTLHAENLPGGSGAAFEVKLARAL